MGWVSDIAEKIKQREKYIQLQMKWQLYASEELSIRGPIIFASLVERLNSDAKEANLKVPKLHYEASHGLIWWKRKHRKRSIDMKLETDGHIYFFIEGQISSVEQVSQLILTGLVDK